MPAQLQYRKAKGNIEFHLDWRGPCLVTCLLEIWLVFIQEAFCQLVYIHLPVRDKMIFGFCEYIATLERGD